MPYVGLAIISAAAGAEWLAQRWRSVAAILVAVPVGAAVVTNTRWYSTLHEDDSDNRIIQCLNRAGVRAATGDYWIAYRMTFLADESVVVNPNINSRYPPYERAASEAPRPIWIQYTNPEATERRAGTVFCSSETIEAVVLP